MTGQRIDDSPELTPYAEALKALGYQSKEEVLGVAQAARADLSRYLGADVGALLPSLGPQAAASGEVPADRPLGVVLDRIPAFQFAFALPVAAAAAAPLPASTDLFAELPPPLDQGERSTCVAFAALAAVEQRALHQGAYQQRSEQFLYWECKHNDGIPTLPGTFLAVAFRLLQSAGCCMATTWTYNPNVVAGNESQDPPPPPAVGEAAAHKVIAYNTLPPTSVPDVQRELAGGNCVAISIPVFNSWYRNPVVESSGDIINPLPGESVVGGHAVTIIGYQDSADPGLGGGRFLIRNSWSNWGSASLHGPGYGTIPYSYIDRFGKEAYALV